MSFIILGQGLVVVTNDDGTVSALPGFPTQVDGGAQQALAAALFNDAAEAIHAPSILNTTQSLSPALIAADDAVYAPTTSLFLLPAPMLLDALVVETVYAPSIANTLQVLLPSALASDDAIHAPSIGFPTLSLLPARITDADVI